MIFARAVASIERVSRRVYAALVVVLLVLVYVLVLPWFALVRRLRRAPPGGWRRRADPGLSSIERLRSLF